MSVYWTGKASDKNGYILAELIAALAILGILAAIFAPVFIGFIEKAKEADSIAEAKYVSTAVDCYILETYGREADVSVGKLFAITGKDINSSSHPLTDYIRKSCTRGAWIEVVLFGEENHSYNGIVYRVRDYRIVLKRGEMPVVEKVK